jgi:hypothetical protein
LRRLLKLKRYEQPPPRYFNDFSSQVIARIKLGDRGESNAPLMVRILGQASWLQRTLVGFDAKPVVTGAFYVAICAFIVTGLIHSESSGAQSMALIPNIESSGFSSEQIATALAANHPLLVKQAPREASSTDPIPAVPFSDHW